MAAPGPESYASAIVAFDASTEDVRVLVETPAYEEGHTEIEAGLAATREMQRH
jgi:hypothetical protein